MAVPKRFKFKKKKFTKKFTKKFNSLLNPRIFFKMAEYI